MDIFDMKEQPPGVLDALPAETLATLQREAEAHFADASQMLAIMHTVLTRRYAAGLNDTGTHNRVDGDIEIKVTVPKSVAWDQEKLATACETIKGWGENPADYLDIKFSISETKFKSWPPAIRDLFEPARSVKPGKPKFELSQAKREAA